MMRSAVQGNNSGLYCTAGNGECDCETDECKCRMEEKSKLLYGGSKCECNPIICYSEEHKGVRHMTSYLGMAQTVKHL